MKRYLLSALRLVVTIDFTQPLTDLRTFRTEYIDTIPERVNALQVKMEQFFEQPYPTELAERERYNKQRTELYVEINRLQREMKYY